jgi:hypothetical protein
MQIKLFFLALICASVMWGHDYDDRHIAVTPEPAASALVVAGLGLMFLISGRRMKK